MNDFMMISYLAIEKKTFCRTAVVPPSYSYITAETPCSTLAAEYSTVRLFLSAIRHIYSKKTKQQTPLKKAEGKRFETVWGWLAS